jgi:hypothetical protein
VVVVHRVLLNGLDLDNGELPEVEVFAAPDAEGQAVGVLVRAQAWYHRMWAVSRAIETSGSLMS